MKDIAPEPKPSWVALADGAGLEHKQASFNAARFGTGSRPGFFVRRDFGVGGNGPMSFHNSSSTISAGIPHDPVAQILEINRSQVKLVASQGYL